MSKNQKFSIAKRLKSFKYAIAGLKTLIREEHNSRIHLFATISVICMGIYFKINAQEWIAIFFAIGLVISLELVNSAIENIADFVTIEKHLKIKNAKDMAAAAVLVGAIVSVLIGLIVFIPKILILFK